jgi:hypothetical protein
MVQIRICKESRELGNCMYCTSLSKMRHRAAILLNGHPTATYTHSTKQKFEEILVSLIMTNEKEIKK